VQKVHNHIEKNSENNETASSDLSDLVFLNKFIDCMDKTTPTNTQIQSQAPDISSSTNNLNPALQIENINSKKRNSDEIEKLIENKNIISTTDSFDHIELNDQDVPFESPLKKRKLEHQQEIENGQNQQQVAVDTSNSTSHNSIQLHKVVTADQQQKNLQNNQTQQINNNEISTKASSANSSLPIKIEAIQKHDDYSQKKQHQLQL